MGALEVIRGQSGEEGVGERPSRPVRNEPEFFFGDLSQKGRVSSEATEVEQAALLLQRLRDRYQRTRKKLEACRKMREGWILPDWDLGLCL